MIGLKALPGRRSSLSLQVAPLRLLDLSKGDDQSVWEDVAAADNEDGRARPDAAALDAARAEEARARRAFLAQFLAAPGATPCQPLAVLQSRYSSLQHEVSRQAPARSVKGWFHDTRADEQWWTSTIVVPGDVAARWGVRTVHESGGFPLTLPEATALCGVHRTVLNTIQFKSKKGAQKSAALNLLLAMNRDGLPNSKGGVEEDGGSRSNEIASKDDLSISNNDYSPMKSKERFHLLSIEFHGTAKDPHGRVFSRSNPCMVRCTVSIRDPRCSDSKGDVFEIQSDLFHNEYEAKKATFDQLRALLVDRGATEDELDGVYAAMRTTKPTIAYALTVPPWAAARIGDQWHLYELEFSCRRRDRAAAVPLAEALGLDALAATRIGVACGGDLFAGSALEKALRADFGLAMRRGRAELRVRMCSRTVTSLADLGRQVREAVPKTELREGEGPATLARCFNIIIFDHGKKNGYGSNLQLSCDDLLNRAERHGHRTCLFLPLHAHSSQLEIDWRLVWDVVHHKSSRGGTEVRFPVSLLRRIALGMSFVMSVACAAVLVFMFHRRFLACHLSLRHQNWVYILLLVMLFLASLSTGLNSVKTVPSSLLKNHFLTAKGFGKRVFILKHEMPVSMTSIAPLLWRMLKTMLHESWTKRSLANMKNVRHIWKYCRHPLDPLVPAQLLKGPYELQEETLFRGLYSGSGTGQLEKGERTPMAPTRSVSNLLASRGLLPPEHVQVLPMPRDMLYLCQHASRFMAALERTHTLTIAAARLCELAGKSACCKTLSKGNIFPILNKATTIRNNTNAKDPLRSNERMEVLGDSVLLYIIVLNLFSKHLTSTTQNALDLFEQVISLQGSNKRLCKAAKQIGLHWIVHVNEVTSNNSWRSLYKTSPIAGGTARELSEKQMSDIFESVLGATYLIDPSGCMTVGVLNEIGSCLLNTTEESESMDWFAGKGTCLTEGYPLNSHAEWTVETAKIERILQQNCLISATLQEKAFSLCQLLNKMTNSPNRIEVKRTLLLQCALFDDSLEDQDCVSDTSGLEMLAILRDKLFHVGNAALQLSVVSHLYHLYPFATSGDIHLMKNVLMSNGASIQLVNKSDHCPFF